MTTQFEELDRSVHRLIEEISEPGKGDAEQIAVISAIAKEALAKIDSYRRDILITYIKAGLDGCTTETLDELSDIIDNAEGQRS